jgi:MFS superfamily sulfate permease-like transporter
MISEIVRCHANNGAPIGSLFIPNVEITEPDSSTTLVTVKNSAVFSTWIGLRRKLLSIKSDRSVALDLPQTRIVDRTAMEKLHEMEMDFEQKHRKLIICGLESHRGLSDHPHSAQVRTAS